jgi:patatin-like phospholipase/acyl hydrolase
MNLGGKIFGKKRNWWKPWETWKYLQANYDSSALDASLEKAFEGIKLGDSDIKTGLCIVSKRADTNSTWPLINHPKGKYFDSDIGKNKDIPLWQAVRASSAAPTYFTPQMIEVGNGQMAAFVDGGVSMANNPSLTLLMVATLSGFPYHWKMGKDNITLVSVGTGYSIFEKKTGAIEKAWIGTWAQNVPNMLMQDASWQVQTVLQWMSESPTAIEIDGEMGTLTGDLVNDKAALKYLRYNLAMTKDNLNAMNLGQTFDDEAVADVVEMSNAKNRYLLYDIGVKAAASIKPEHFD